MLEGTNKCSKNQIKSIKLSNGLDIYGYSLLTSVKGEVEACMVLNRLFSDLHTSYGKRMPSPLLHFS